MLVGGWGASNALGQDRWSLDPARDRAGTAESLWQGSNWLGTSTSVNEWTLGVRGDSTDTGFLISQVTPGGAADRARIQRGDVVVTVDGYQVGMISGRLYDLTHELNRRADSTGVVRLLLQDGQTGRLSSVRVRLDNQLQRLTGTLLARRPLPADAIITVQIENVSRPQWGVRNGQQSFSAPAQQNIAFQIAYDPQYVLPQDIYQVRAFVSSGGRDILYTPQPVRVLTQGNPHQVRLQLEEVISTAANSTSGTFTSYSNYNQLDDEVTRIYQRYLGRPPSAAELAAARIVGVTCGPSPRICRSS